MRDKPGHVASDRSTKSSSGGKGGGRDSQGGGKVNRDRGKSSAAGSGRKDHAAPAKGGGKSKPESNRYKDISRAGKGFGFNPTSTTGGKHNPGSLHAKGRAVDFSVKGKTKQQVDKFIADMKKKGYKVRDERKQPKGQKVWSGPHIHVSSPAAKSKSGGGSKSGGRKSESGRGR